MCVFMFKKYLSTKIETHFVNLGWHKKQTQEIDVIFATLTR